MSLPWAESVQAAAAKDPATASCSKGAFDDSTRFLERTSTDDYGNMLLETAIGHGTNIRELARDMSVSVWDPSPSSTAAWKLAFSLVTKSLRPSQLLWLTHE